MPDSNSITDSGSHSAAKRSLPSWMSSKENRNKSQKKQNDATEILPKSDQENYTAISYDDRQNNSEFSKLLEGVVFVLSGFVNPERSTLRAHAVEMGAEYQPDWTSGCTLLICAFPNTPKFRQVENDQGTIVSKEWIFECYNNKKLVDIERYLMHVGKPWRRCAEQNQPNKVQGNVLSAEPIKRAEKSSLSVTGSQSSEGGLPRSSDNLVPPSQIKEWAADDLSKTISWLESQDEKPEAIEIKLIAAEGIMTCLQDAIDSLNQNKSVCFGSCLGSPKFPDTATGSAARTTDRAAGTIDHRRQTCQSLQVAAIPPAACRLFAFKLLASEFTGEAHQIT